MGKKAFASNTRKLFSIFIVIFLFPMLLMSVTNLWAVHHDTVKTASQFAEQLLQHNGTTVDNVFELVDRSFSQLFMNDDVMEFFRSTSRPSTFDEYKRIATIYSSMRTIIENVDGYISTIYLYNKKNDLLLSSQQSMKYDTKLFEKDCFRTLMETPGYHTVPFLTDNDITVSRVVYSITEQSGSMIILLNRNRVKQLIGRISMEDNGSFLIMDNNGQIIISDQTYDNEMLNKALGSFVHGTTQIHINGEDYLAYTQNSTQNTWVYMWLLPFSKLNNSSSSIITRLLVLYISFFLVIIIGFYFLSREIFLPFISLYDRMTGKDTDRKLYLLKRLTIMSELDNGIAQMRDELDEVRTKDNIILSENVALREQIIQYSREYCDRVVQKLIDGNQLSRSEIKSFADLVQIPIDRAIVFSIIQADGFSYEKIDTQLRKHLANFQTDADELEYRLLIEKGNCYYILFIFGMANTKKEERMGMVVAALENLRQELFELVHNQSFIVLGDYVNTPEFLNASFETANMRLKYAQVLSIQNILYNLKEQKLVPAQLLEHNDALARAVNDDDLDLAAEETKTISVALQGEILSTAFCMLFTKNIIRMYLQYMLKHSFSKQLIDQTYEDIQHFFEKFRSVSEATQYMNRMMEALHAKYEAVPKRTHEIASKAQEIIHNEYSRYISLQEVADRLGVNASYLSRIFKDSIGTNFKEYLIEFRLVCAKKFLEEGYSVVEVSEKIGYQDAGQFTRIFKKYLGMTPNIYQNTHKS